MTNLDKYKNDLKKLVSEGNKLLLSMKFECYPKQFEEYYESKPKKDFDKFKKNRKPIKEYYQTWYSEALILLNQLLPDRVLDFKKLYEKPKTRKSIEHSNYVMEDYLQGLVVTRGYQEEKVVGPESALNQLEQQIAIVKSVEKRFESSLFDIKQLTQADIFDSELDSARELNKKGFVRGAGAIAGVVLEKHLAQVCINHKIRITKKNPSIADFNDKLKTEQVIETKDWRKIQHLGDIRNLCDHNKEKEPKNEDAEDLIDGVEKLIKTLF
ncbi:hypothetical protein LNJ05_12955 [Tenacibaculum finnmarkense genomovar ulcerans]|uniref:hypothetical protein n=1 Tax=Tenacibaculum finnmarkense TaxID=2781243 RepID=UPI001E3B5B48|nr:hypothetical protein [Tenacibaculum finnmarkense]MCD8433672.1 hypothetical protein [Tenacibaculum finnmarkense genomovar ulcerans]